MAKQASVALKAVVSVISKGAKEKAMLEEDLRRMGCYGLIQWPWCIKYKKIVLELQQKRDNRWNRIVQQDPKKWMVVACERCTAFQSEARVWQCGEGKFTHLPHPKDGYPLSDCKDPRAKRLSEFFVPIFYPEKSA